jgi:hypothetical protein
VRLELACDRAVDWRVEAAAESEVRPFPRWNIPIVVALPVAEEANYADRTAELHWDASRWSAGCMPLGREAGEEGAKRSGGSLRLV